MNEALYIVGICKVDEGWQTPIIFRESQQKEMDKLILDAKLQHHTVTTTWIYGHAVESLRQFFLAEKDQ